MKLCIISQDPMRTLKIAGQGYSTIQEAKKFIKLFKSRIDALNEVQKEILGEEIATTPLEYFVIPLNDIIAKATPLEVA